MASSLPDHVLAEIDLFARRLKNPRRTFLREALAGWLHRVRHAVIDALDGAARESVISPPP